MEYSLSCITSIDGRYSDRTVDNSYDIIKSITRKDSEFSIDNVLKEIEGKLEYHLNKNKIIDEIKLLDVNNYTGIYE